MSIRYRYADPSLLQLGPPPALAVQPFETIYDRSLSMLQTEMAAAGILIDTTQLLSEPSVIHTRVNINRDLLRRQEIDDAVSQTYLGHATGGHLDQRAADYGVLRRSLPHTIAAAPPLGRPGQVPPTWTWDTDAALWREDDASLRNRARLAWEALSVAGPNGAYVFHALDSHPAIAEAVAYGPESGIVDPGEVLVVIRSGVGDWVPTYQMLAAVAARIDAVEVISGTGVSTVRAVRDDQAVRPLGARVTVQAGRPLGYDVAAHLYVRPGGDVESLRATGETRLLDYLAARSRLGMEVPITGMIAAVHIAGADYLPVADEVVIAAPLSDIVPSHDEFPRPNVVTVTAEVR